MKLDKILEPVGVLGELPALVSNLSFDGINKCLGLLQLQSDNFRNID